MTHAFLADRAFLTVGGVEAESFLQNLITTDLAGLSPGEAAPGALLTPQGKILFFFLISRDGAGFRLETDSASASSLLKRLMMYRLRAAVDLAVEDGTGVMVSMVEAEGGIRDRRFAKAGVTVERRPAKAGEGGDRDAYDHLRVLHGIAEPAYDFALGDAFPHDVLMDLNGGLSFRKGCYVGQEVVSRMQHRSTARRRVVTVSGSAALPPSGASVTAGGKTIGTLGTRSDNQGLALVRIDKAGAAIAAGEPVLAAEMPVTLTLAPWSGLSFPAEAAGEEP